MPIITSLPAFIGFGDSLSTVVDTVENYVVGIIMPDAWTDARVSVQVSPDAAQYHDLFDFNLGELVFPTTAGAAVAVDYRRFLMARYIKLRSGTREHPVDQEETRAFTIITVDSIDAPKPKPVSGERAGAD